MIIIIIVIIIIVVVVCTYKTEHKNEENVAFDMIIGLEKTENLCELVDVCDTEIEMFYKQRPQ